MYSELQNLGMSPFFVSQLTLQEREHGCIARVSRVHRSVLRMLDRAGEQTLPLPGDYRSLPPQDRPTVGDWVVLSDDRSRIERVLKRKSVFRRVLNALLKVADVADALGAVFPVRSWR